MTKRLILNPILVISLYFRPFPGYVTKIENTHIQICRKLVYSYLVYNHEIENLKIIELKLMKI